MTKLNKKGRKGFSAGSRGTGPRKSGLIEEIPWIRKLPETHAYAYGIGERIGKDLTVIGHLSSGRWSELYQVWSSREWCPLICKILSKRWLTDRKALAALRRERRILKRLHHPNIIRIFGDGEHGGAFFLLLEYLEGPTTLDALENLPNRQMAVADAVRTAIQAGAGLDHLHRRGFLHLDVKPANLLLRGGIPVLMDFDSARKTQPARPPRTLLGTAPFMSPEQVMRLPLGVPADIYGLGAALYELLTGRWPFEDFYYEKGKRSGLEANYPQIGDKPPPSIRTIRPEISSSLSRTVMKSIRHDPKDRYQSIPEYLEALAAELRDSVSLWPKQTYPTRI